MTNNRLYRMNIVNGNFALCVNMMWKQRNICFLNVTKSNMFGQICNA